ncbi:MAG: serine hydrolase domain-containing protein, partial [Myxococcota bacterium]
MEASAPVHGHCEPRFQAVRDVFEKNIKEGLDLGAAVAFTLDGEPVVDLWGGHLEFDRKDEWQRDTLVNVYSTTKGMTAICAHQLVERGLLDLSAPVADYWPEFAAAGKQELPVHYLLSHRAGLPAVRDPLPKDSLYDWDTFTAALAAQEPWWEPGTQHGYHAITFGHLVGELIRRVSGQSVGRYFEENVAGPLEADFHIGM